MTIRQLVWEGYILKDCLTSLYAHQLEETMKGLIHVQIGHIYILVCSISLKSSK